MKWEIDFIKYIFANIHSDILTEAMKIITSLGNYGLMWIVLSAILIAYPKTRAKGISMAISLIIMFISVNIIVKPFIDRARPFEADMEILKNIAVSLPKDGSFPSGHTAAAFAASVCAFCYNKRQGMLLLIIAFLIGISRLYLGVHFPTDVMGGIIFGTLSGITGFKLGCKIMQKNIKNS